MIEPLFARDKRAVDSLATLLSRTEMPSIGALEALFARLIGPQTSLDASDEVGVEVSYASTSEWLPYPFSLAELWEAARSNYPAFLAFEADVAEMNESDPTQKSDILNTYWFSLPTVTQHMRHAAASDYHEFDADLEERVPGIPGLIFGSYPVTLVSNGSGQDDEGLEPVEAEPSPFLSQPDEDEREMLHEIFITRRAREADRALILLTQIDLDLLTRLHSEHWTHFTIRFTDWGREVELGVRRSGEEADTHSFGVVFLQSSVPPWFRN